MKIKYKKIIAREFIIFTIVISSGIITFLLTYPYNYYQEKIEKTFLSEILIKSKQLDLLYTSALKNKDMDEAVIEDLYNRAKSLGYKKSRNEFIALIHSNNEVFNDMYSYFKSMGYRNDENAFAILIGRIPTQQNYQSISTITPEIKVLEDDLDKLRNNREIFVGRIMSLEEQITVSIWVTAMTFVILVVLRFIYYGISWSISTLRSE